MDAANELRGEVDLELDGQTFVLRPSYEAILAIEKQTGRDLMQLAMAADVSSLNLETLTIVVTECIRAWGRSVAVEEADEPERKSLISTARMVNKAAIGPLLFTAGVMLLLPRVAIVLGMAVTGGCLPSGELKPMTGTMTNEIPGVGLPE